MCDNRGSVDTHIVHSASLLLIPRTSYIQKSDKTKLRHKSWTLLRTNAPTFSNPSLRCAIGIMISRQETSESDLSVSRILYSHCAGVLSSSRGLPCVLPMAKCFVKRKHKPMSQNLVLSWKAKNKRDIKQTEAIRQRCLGIVLTAASKSPLTHQLQLRGLRRGLKRA